MTKTVKRLNYIMRSPVVIKSIFVLISLVYLALHLIIAGDYSLSWDFHDHHYAGLYHLGQEVPKVSESAPVPFSPPDPRKTVEDPFGPFTQIIPTLSYLLFYKNLNIMPFDLAYNLPIIIFGVLGVYLLYLFLYQAKGFRVSLVGGTFLALLPSYFGYLHNNMKDIPNAFAFAVSIYFFWKLESKRDLGNLFLSVLAFAFAFNVKVNSVIIPLILFLWFFLIGFSDTLKFVKGKLDREKRKKLVIVYSYFILAPLAAILLWWPFWNDPLGKLLSIPSFYSQNTLNMPVLFAGEILRSGVNIPWYYPYVYILITTPLSILISFLFGLAVSFGEIFKIRQFFPYITGKSRSKASLKGLRVDFSENGKFYLLLLLWFFVPLVRYFNPKMGAIDGVRHFMEVVYPLCAISAVGAVSILSAVKKKLGGKISLVAVAVSLSFLLYNLYKFHPYQTSFFNGVVGGIRGAWGKYDIDFWGGPQKEAVTYLNDHAPTGSTVHIVMGQSTAAEYLRDDLKARANLQSMWESDYTVVLNRESFFSFYDVENYISSKNPEDIIFHVEIDDVPLVWVFVN